MHESHRKCLESTEMHCKTFLKYWHSPIDSANNTCYIDTVKKIVI